VQWLLVLVVLWGAVLIPPWIADRCRDRPVQTMASFTRRLQQLEQLEHAPYASEALARDAYDTYDAYGDEADDVAGYEGADEVPVGSSSFRSVRAVRSGRPDPMARLARPVDSADAVPGYNTYADADADEHFDDEAPGRPDSGVSRSALRRRRQIFFCLLTAVVGSLVVLLALRTATAVYVHVGALVLFTTYVTLLVRHHQRATERVSKVRYLSPIRAPRPAVVVLRSGTAR